MSKGTILYVGGFQLPDKNAAAMRVLANAKALKKIGYTVVFVNAITSGVIDNPRWVECEGFACYEYQRENQKTYLLNCELVLNIIKEINATILIAYNYPAIALNKMRKYCRKHEIKCYADATEWYIPKENLIFRLAKGFDTEFRMRYVHTKMDGVIAISKYLYEYYKNKVKTVKIPPLVDLNEGKWKGEVSKEHIGISMVYAGSPSVQKERLDLIVKSVDEAPVKERLHLDVIGLSKEQYNSMYRCCYKGDRVTFWGRISNDLVIRIIKEADFSIVLREKNKVVQAGFPTKIAEAISCGTVVIANRFSNIDEYLDESNSILLDSVDEFPKLLLTVEQFQYPIVNNHLFDYRVYLDEFEKIMN